jgi:hypothetical protein
MGGGGGYSDRTGDLKALVDKAKEKLSATQAGERRNVFISFAYEDINEVNLLRGQAKNANLPIQFNDWSVPEAFDSERSDYIRSKIGERINQSSVTVVYLSSVTPKSSWVEWEIKESLRLGKQVIGVYSGEAAPSRFPTVFKSRKLKAIPWSKLAATLDKLP